jgi:hypothetical protein
MTARSSGRFGEKSNTSRLRPFRLHRVNKINLAKMRPPSLTIRLQYVSYRIMCDPVLPITQLRREWFCKPIFRPAQNRSLDICLSLFSILSMPPLPSDEADDLSRSEFVWPYLRLRGDSIHILWHETTNPKRLLARVWPLPVRGASPTKDLRDRKLSALRSLYLWRTSAETFYGRP